MDEDTVLANKRHQVGQRRKRHDVQVVFEIDPQLGARFSKA